MNRSPFPGMDPYVEPHWLDVHTALVAEARTALNASLPDDLIASVEERIAIESQDGEDRLLFGPDVRVFEPASAEAAVVEVAAGATATDAPFRLLAQVEPITERFIRVVRAGTERLVSVIEFVSPTNKQGGGLHAFRSKRAELLSSGVNFVEVDLVRAGDWRALLRPHVCARRAASTYRVTIRLPDDPGAVHLYPIGLRQRLPAVTIPLRRRDPKVALDLQPLFERAYANGRYARRLDYSKPVEPPLDPVDAAWVEELLKSVRRDQTGG